MTTSARSAKLAGLPLCELVQTLDDLDVNRDNSLEDLALLSFQCVQREADCFYFSLLALGIMISFPILEVSLTNSSAHRLNS